VTEIKFLQAICLVSELALHNWIFF